jgi:hypothetical protein
MERRLRAAAAALRGGRVALKELEAAHGSAARHSVRVLRAAPCMLPLPGVGTALGLGLTLRDGLAVLLGAVTALLALLFTAGLLLGAWHCGLTGLDRLSGA